MCLFTHKQRNCLTYRKSSPLSLEVRVIMGYDCVWCNWLLSFIISKMSLLTSLIFNNHPNPQYVTDLPRQRPLWCHRLVSTGWNPLDNHHDNRPQGRIQDFWQGGGVNDGRVLRAPLAPAPTGGLGLINIRLRYIASIEYSEQFFLFFFFAIVKKFVDNKNWWSRAGGGHDPPPPPGSAPGPQRCG